MDATFENCGKGLGYHSGIEIFFFFSFSLSNCFNNSHHVLTTVLNLAYCARKSNEQYLEVQEKLKEEKKKNCRRKWNEIKRRKVIRVKRICSKIRK